MCHITPRNTTDNKQQHTSLQINPTETQNAPNTNKGTLEEQIYRRQLYKQHHTNGVVYGTTETRLFEGVKGIKPRQGELFGIANLLKFTPDAVETVRCCLLLWVLLGDAECWVPAGCLLGAGCWPADASSWPPCR